MWWNFIGRSHDEIVAYRTAWERRDPRFPPVVDRAERVMEAPPMPTVALKPRPSQTGPAVNPVEALREIGFLLERSRADTFRVRAYRAAADAVAAMSAEERQQHTEQRTWNKVTGVGPKTATVITQALAGQVPGYLQKLRDEKEPLVDGGQAMRAGDPGRPALPLDLVRRRQPAGGDDDHCAGARPRVLRDHRPLAAAQGGPGPERRAAAGADDRQSRPERGDGAVPRAAGDRGGHPGGRRSRPDRRAARPARRGRGQRALQAALGLRDHDAPDGRGHRQPAHQRPRSLHRTADRRASGASGRSRSSTPRWSSRPAVPSTSRWRSTPGPSAGTRRPGC